MQLTFFHTGTQKTPKRHTHTLTHCNVPSCLPPVGTSPYFFCATTQPTDRAWLKVGGLGADAAMVQHELE